MLLVTSMAMVSIFFALAAIYVFLSSRASEQQVIRGLESAVREREENGEATGVSFAKRALSWIRAHAMFIDLKKTREQMMMAGLRDEWQADAYFAARVALPLLGLAASTFLHEGGMFWSLILVVFGFLLPDLWLTTMIRRRRDQIRLALPDTLDLLVICVEAGLGLDQALYRVGAELCVRHPAVSQELAQVNLEQRAGKSRLDAWRSFAQRSKLEEIESFVGMLWQTDRFGTPIVRALATYAESLRTKRRQKAEELAAKSTVKLIFPLVLFIFPCMFIVLIGPAALNVMRNLGGFFD